MSPAPRRRADRADQSIREEASAGGVVYRRAGGQTYFLVIRDSYQNWGFPKGHIEDGEAPDRAALREVAEETGLRLLELHSAIDTIDWHFRFRGRPIHKVCHFFLMESLDARTKPQVDEGITACQWATYDEAARLLSYENARAVLAHGRRILHEGGGDLLSVRQAG